MTMKIDQETAEIGVRLLDDAHLVWSAAQLECEIALHEWLDGGPRENAARYYRYRAALEREAAAALDLQRLSERARPCHDYLAGLGSVP
jgi:hypothetical protein